MAHFVALEKNRENVSPEALGVLTLQDRVGQCDEHKHADDLGHQPWDGGHDYD